MRAFASTLRLLPVLALLAAAASPAAAQQPSPPPPATWRPRLDGAGTYDVEGRLAAQGGTYRGTLVLERVSDAWWWGGAVKARFTLVGPDGATLSRPEATGLVRGGRLRLRFLLPGTSGITGALGGGPPGGTTTTLEARYDLRALTGTLTLDGQPYAFERLTYLRRIVVLHTNDSHGQVLPFTDTATGRRIGGFAARATIVRAVRREVRRTGAALLVLDAGDVNTGAPESDLLDAEPDFACMNAIGYHALAVGNHEFDNPREVLLRQRGWATFPFLSANVLDEATGAPVFEPTLLVRRAGLRVGIFGLTTESAAFITLPENRRGLRFEPALDAAARVVPRLRARSDLVIALTHCGYYPNGEHGASTPGDVELARAVPGIDVVVGGHTHTALPQPVIDSGAIIVQAQDRGRLVGRLDLLVDAGRRIVRHEYRQVPVVVADPQNPASADVVAEDPQVAALLAPFVARVNGLLDTVVATTPVVLDGERPRVRAGETNLSRLITDAFREAGGTDLAFAIGGGIRASIGEGEVTWREVMTVQPFGNSLVRGRLTGAQVLEVLQLAARQVPPAGGFLHASGLTATLEAGQVRDVTVGGAPLDLQATYSVTCDRFVGEGGENYLPFKSMTDREDLPLLDRDALRAYLEAHGVPDSTGTRRITFVPAPPAPAPAPAPPAPAPTPGH